MHTWVPAACYGTVSLPSHRSTFPLRLPLPLLGPACLSLPHTPHCLSSPTYCRVGSSSHREVGATCLGGGYRGRRTFTSTTTPTTRRKYSGGRLTWRLEQVVTHSWRNLPFSLNHLLLEATNTSLGHLPTSDGPLATLLSSPTIWNPMPASAGGGRLEFCTGTFSLSEGRCTASPSHTYHSTVVVSLTIHYLCILTVTWEEAFLSVIGLAEGKSTLYSQRSY